MFPELIGVVIVAIMFCIAVLLAGRGKQSPHNDEGLPGHEILARGMEEAAEAFIADAKADAARGGVSTARRSLLEAEQLFDRARQIRKEAMEKIANGEFL